MVLPSRTSKSPTKISKIRVFSRIFPEITHILDIFAGDLEVRLGKKHAVILSFSCSIEWYSFY